jgi:hypothetical protein
MFQSTHLCVLTQLEEEVAEGEAARNGGRSWKRIVWAGFVASILALAILTFAGLDGLSSSTAAGRHPQSWEISLLSSANLPEDVQSCIKACVHVNLMVASSGHSTYGQASCDSCSQLQPVDEQRTMKHDSRKLRLVDDLWRHVHRHELCKAVADDDELYNRCTGTNIWRKPWKTNDNDGGGRAGGGGKESEGGGRGDARDVISRWAAGSSPLRQCIASAQDFEDAQRCMDRDHEEDENHDAHPDSSHHDRHDNFYPNQRPQKFKDVSAYAKDVSDQCRGLEGNQVLLHDCLEVEDGMQHALKPIDGDRWSRGLENRHPQAWREASSKGKHAGYEDARAAARDAERLVGGHHQHFIRREEQPLRPIPHTFANSVGPNAGFSQRGREATKPMFHFNALPKPYPSSTTAVQNSMPTISPLKKTQIQPSSVQAPASSRQSASSSPSPLDSATAKAIATLTESVARLQHAIESGQNMRWNATMSQAPIITVSPIIKVSPIISVNLSSAAPQHDMPSSYTPRESEENSVSTQRDASQNALLGLLNKTINFLESEKGEDSRRQPSSDVNESVSRLEKRVSDIEGKVDKSASPPETPPSSEKPTESGPTEAHEGSAHEAPAESAPQKAQNDEQVAPHAAAGETDEGARNAASHPDAGEHNEAQNDAEHGAAGENASNERHNDAEHDGAAGETAQNEGQSENSASHAPTDDVKVADAKEHNMMHHAMPSKVPTPMIEPAGGLFKNPVIVHLSYTHGETVYYTTDGAAPTEKSSLYNGPFALLAGSNTRVGAVAMRSSDEAYSNVTWASFEVQPCVMHDSKCCHWQEVLARFDALQQALEWRNQTLAETETFRSQQAAETQHEWLDSEVAYRQAIESVHMQRHAAKYAVQLAEIWKQASTIAKRRFAAIHAQNDAERKQLEDERALILEILDMLVNLEADRQSSASTAAKQMVRIQSRLRRLPKDGAYGSALESLASSLTDRTEAAEIRELLEDMLRDVEARTALIYKVIFMGFECVHVLVCMFVFWDITALIYSVIACATMCVLCAFLFVMQPLCCDCDLSSFQVYMCGHGVWAGSYVCMLYIYIHTTLCRSKRRQNRRCNTTKTSCGTGRSRQRTFTSLNANQSAYKSPRVCAGTYLRVQLQPTRSGRRSRRIIKSSMHRMRRRFARCKCSLQRHRRPCKHAMYEDPVSDFSRNRVDGQHVRRAKLYMLR